MLPETSNFDVLIEELSFENFREGDDDLRILNVGDLRFDIFPDNVVQLLGEDQLHRVCECLTQDC